MKKILTLLLLSVIVVGCSAKNVTNDGDKQNKSSDKDIQVLDTSISALEKDSFANFCNFFSSSSVIIQIT
jgi:uncharacterized protein YcfL